MTTIKINGFELDIEPEYNDSGEMVDWPIEGIDIANIDEAIDFIASHLDEKIVEAKTKKAIEDQILFNKI